MVSWPFPFTDLPKELRIPKGRSRRRYGAPVPTENVIRVCPGGRHAWLKAPGVPGGKVRKPFTGLLQ